MPKITISNMTFVGNQAWFGGGMSANSADIAHTLFAKNGALLDGGALNLMQSVSLSVLNNVSVHTNSAGREGGGVYAQGYLALISCRIIGNMAKVKGGGVWAGAQFLMVNSELLCNEATNGGALSVKQFIDAIGLEIETEEVRQQIPKAQNVTDELQPYLDKYTAADGITNTSSTWEAVWRPSSNDIASILPELLTGKVTLKSWFGNVVFNNDAVEQCDSLVSSWDAGCLDSLVAFDSCYCHEQIVASTDPHTSYSQQLLVTPFSCHHKCEEGTFADKFLDTCHKCGTCGNGSIIQECTTEADTVCECPAGYVGNECQHECFKQPMCIESSTECHLYGMFSGECVLLLRMRVRLLRMSDMIITDVWDDSFVEDGLCQLCSTCSSLSVQAADEKPGALTCEIDGASCETVLTASTKRNPPSGRVVKECTQYSDATCLCVDGFTGVQCTNRCSYPPGAASLEDPYNILRCKWNRTDTAWGVSAQSCYDGFYIDLVSDDGETYYFLQCIPWTICKPGEIQSVLPDHYTDRDCSAQLNVTFYFADGWPPLNESEISQLSKTWFGTSQVPFILADISDQPTAFRRQSDGSNLTGTYQNFIMPIEGQKEIMQTRAKEPEMFLDRGIYLLMVNGEHFVVEYIEGFQLSAGAIAGIAVGCVSVVALVALLFWFLYKRHRRIESRMQEKMNNIAKTLFKRGGSVSSEAVLREMQKSAKPIDRDSFTILECIGSGQFGTVNKGVVFLENQSSICAIKVTKMDSGDDILKEAGIMQSFTHANVVRAFGLCSDSGDIFLLLEFCDLGDAQHHLASLSQSDPVPMRIKIMILEQVACGMKYLDDMKIVHRDIAARNVLLQTPNSHNRPPRAKVSDLGLARELDEHSQYTKTSQSAQLPVRWMAPENIMDFKANQATDVWAFGITAWEILSNGMMPFESLKNKEVIVLLTNPNLNISTYLMKQDHWSDDIYRIILDCTAFEPDDRPSFDMLINDFTRIVRNLGRLTVDEKNDLMTYNENIKCKFTWMMGDGDVNALVHATTKRMIAQRNSIDNTVYTELQQPVSRPDSTAEECERLPSHYSLGVENDQESTQRLGSSANLFDYRPLRSTPSSHSSDVIYNEEASSARVVNPYLDLNAKSND
ncbi:TK protein kinase, variant [Sphaeroforma arctica JP610]|uniref:TK protein kinase, variant n=1 Tax=Sphaeroforma arctica JP610 TaxID=667725 RepID=A0A0L0G926_9EUKA|nr:TK protein kinase, variant [Sphaeroforma arctica JP610]KNC84748.1 TK protein kinase, variant [Sphaeroforma arctica JP610]|eukprot:XP_014158650.1 TK protein kinase, variant [Sphaeroforma arctica JP610]